MIIETVEKSEHTTGINDYGKQLSSDIWGYLPVKLFPAVTGLASIMILTRNLTPEQYGTYSVVMTTVILLLQLTGTWLSNAVLYVYPDYIEKQNESFLRATLKLQAIASVPAALIAYSAILLTTKRHELSLIASGIVVLQLFQFLMMTFLQSARKVSQQAFSVIIQSFAQLTILGALIFFGGGKELAALIAVLAGFCSAIIALLIQSNFYKRSNQNQAEIHTSDLFKKLFSYGIPMCIWFFSTQFYTVGDRLLLKYLGVTSELGQYASFRDLSTGCAGFLTMPLLMASHPIIMSMWKKGCERADIENLMRRNMVLLVVMFVPLIVLIHVCGTELLAQIVGTRYVIDKYVMLMVMASIFLACLSMYIQKGLEVTGQTLAMAKMALVAVVVSLILNTIFLRWFGVIGAASVVVISQIVYLSIVRKFTAHILAPSIPGKLLFTAACWIVSVEAACKILPLILNTINATTLLPYARFVLIIFATLLLYLITIGNPVLLNLKIQSTRLL